MSGHSHAANIAVKKAKQDAVRGKIFTKIGKEIAVAAKLGADPSTNSKLAMVIAKAKSANMPNDNIKRCIQKASGELKSANYEELTYEGYGPNGSAIIINVLTDNKNRAVDMVRVAMRKHGGDLGNSGCVSYMFDRKGVLIIERNAELDEDVVMGDAIEGGADDFVATDDAFEVYTSPTDFSSVEKFLEDKGYKFFEASIQMIPQNTIKFEGESAKKFQKLIDVLDDLDDVQEVFHNVELPEDEEE